MLLHRDEARKTVTLSNGCACHALSGKFEDEMWELLQEERGAERTDYVVVETSGIADPVRLVQSLERKYGKMTRARLDGRGGARRRGPSGEPVGRRRRG